MTRARQLLRQIGTQTPRQDDPAALEKFFGLQTELGEIQRKCKHAWMTTYFGRRFVSKKCASCGAIPSLW